MEGNEDLDFITHTNRQQCSNSDSKLFSCGSHSKFVFVSLTVSLKDKSKIKYYCISQTVVDKNQRFSCSAVFSSLQLHFKYYSALKMKASLIVILTYT